MAGIDLADFLRPPTDAAEPVASAVIENTHPDGAVDLSLRGGLLFRVPVLGWYTPSIGDVVFVLRRNAAQWLVLGTARTSNPATVRTVTSRSMSWTVEAPPPTADPTDNPTGSPAGQLTVSANSSGAYRSADGWGRSGSRSLGLSDLAQGAYSTSLGYYTGCWFLGTKPGAIKGSSVTRTQITLRRQQSSHGTTAGVSLYLWPHAHFDKPSGAPSLVTGEVNGVRGPVKLGPAIRGQLLSAVDLPKQWGQALVDGKIGGFAIRQNNTAEYAIVDGRDVHADSGKLLISYQ